MRFSHSVQEFLSGQGFSNALKVPIATRWEEVDDRFSLLERFVEGKKIVHLGFADHIPLIQDKVRRGVWMHERLAKKTTRCLGIDTNAEAVEYVRKTLPYTDVLHGDIMNPLPEVLNDRWDYVILGEILEHIDDPVRFLSSIRRTYESVIDRIVITVPNAFAWDNIRQLQHGIEFINSDHRYWFTPYTLAKVATRAGFHVDEFFFSEYYPPIRSWKRFLGSRYLINRFFPSSREGLVLTASFRAPTAS